GLTTATGSENSSRSALGIHGDQRGSSGNGEPGKFGVVLALEFCIHMRAGSHHSWSDSCYMDVVAGQLSPNSIREPGECKFARAIGRQVGHSDFAANRGDVDDATTAPHPHFRNDARDQFVGRPKM